MYVCVCVCVYIYIYIYIRTVVCRARIHKCIYIHTVECREAVGPSKVHAVHVDHGFMRHEESETVLKALGNVGENYVYVCTCVYRISRRLRTFM